MTNQDKTVGGVQVPSGAGVGVAAIPEDTALTRLNYFEGRYLRATDLQSEQRYQRAMAQTAQRANGAGLVHGLDVTPLSGRDVLRVSPGLAVDCEGRTLYLPAAVELATPRLLEAATRPAVDGASAPQGASSGQRFFQCMPDAAPAGDGTITDAGEQWWVLRASHAEAPCGQEPVYGRLCDDACQGTNERSTVREGVYFWLQRLSLRTPLATGGVTLTEAHLRSRIASAYFADECRPPEGLVTGAGLRSTAWCHGAEATVGDSVALAVFVRAGSQTRWVDAWIVRRELMETHPRVYWAMRMRMRPWSAFLAQVLQFQCQLRDLSAQPTASPDDDPCRPAWDALQEAQRTLAEMLGIDRPIEGNIRAVTPATDVSEGALRYRAVVDRIALLQRMRTATDRLLLRGGIVELPPGGYLPVSTASNATVNAQVRALLGDGVDLRFCIVRHDYVAHALEEVQHMERISLLEGLENPDRRPEVDILVPDGVAASALGGAAGPGFATDVSLFVGDNAQRAQPLLDTANSPNSMLVLRAPRPSVAFRGASRFDRGADGRVSFAAAGGGLEALSPRSDLLFLRDATHLAAGAGATADPDADAAWLQLSAGRDPSAMRAGDVTDVSGRVMASVTVTRSEGAARVERIDASLDGTLTVTSTATANGLTRTLATLSHADVRTWSREDQGNPSGSRAQGRLELAMRVQPSGAPQVSIAVGLVDEETNRPSGALLLVHAAWTDAPLRIRLSVQEVTLPRGNLSLLSIGAMRSQLARFLESGVEGLGEVTPRPLARATLTWRADALATDSDARTHADQGIQELARSMEQPDYVRILRGILFATTTERPRELTVRPTLDWVMFHRRRTRRCEPEALRAPTPTLPPVVTPRAVERHQVYEVVIRGSDELYLTLLKDGRIADLLRDGDYQGIVTRDLGAAAFDVETSRVSGDTSALASAWNASTQTGARGAIDVVTLPNADGAVRARLLREAISLDAALPQPAMGSDTSNYTVQPSSSGQSWPADRVAVTFVRRRPRTIEGIGLVRDPNITVVAPAAPMQPAIAAPMQPVIAAPMQPVIAAPMEPVIAAPPVAPPTPLDVTQPVSPPEVLRRDAVDGYEWYLFDMPDLALADRLRETLGDINHTQRLPEEFTAYYRPLGTLTFTSGTPELQEPGAALVKQQSNALRGRLLHFAVIGSAKRDIEPGELDTSELRRLVLVCRGTRLPQSQSFTMLRWQSLPPYVRPTAAPGVLILVTIRG